MSVHLTPCHVSSFHSIITHYPLHALEIVNLYVPMKAFRLSFFSRVNAFFAAQKASLFQNKIIRINRHQRCKLENCQQEISKSFKELTEVKASKNKQENDENDLKSGSSVVLKQGDPKQVCAQFQTRIQFLTII